MILLADDDVDTRELIDYELRRAGYEVVPAADGVEVFTLLESHDPTLFLLDCRMPGLDGFECCRRLKEDPRFRDHPVVFLTALTETGHVVHGFEAGGVDYVRKPVIVQELLARIRTQVDLAASRQALRGRADLLEVIAAKQLRRLDEVRTGQELLLTDPGRFHDLRLGLRFQPADVAGGDFYEIAQLDDGDLAVFVADVSGHDLSMPFVTGGLKALMASFLNEVLSPEETMIQLNASLNRFLPTGRFVSACYARFSRARMEVEVINAGHPLPHFQPAGRPAEPLTLVGDVLGIFDTTQFETVKMKVREGDRLFLYTDGLTEGFRDSTGRRGRPLHGMTLLQQCLAETTDRPIQGVVDFVFDRLTESAGAPLEDDVILLGLEF